MNNINEESPATYNQTKNFNYSDLSINELYEKVTGEKLPQNISIRELAKISEKAAMVAELSRRYCSEVIQRGDNWNDVDEIKTFLRGRLRDEKSEVFACAFLDGRHRLIEFETLFYGTVNGSAVHPREVVKKALKHNAAAVIFAHNHPSGVAEPSIADERITKRLQQALELIDVRVLDHFIVGDNIVSFVERGML